MSAADNSVPAPRQGWRWGNFFYAAAAVLLVIFGIALWLYAVARAALPQLDGTIRAEGLVAPVSVVRDEHGVPTIAAASLPDLFFAQGYVTAQDRLWQMDAMRRAAAGDLAEILGPGLADHDREQRILGLRVAAKKTIEIASPQVRAHYEAYARGVNASIEVQRRHLPAEFRILHYAPRPWTPEDTALIAAQMVKDLSAMPRQALVRQKILAKLGAKLTADLYVNSSRHDRPPTTMRKSGLPQPEDDENDDDDDKNLGSDNSLTKNAAPGGRMVAPGSQGRLQVKGFGMAGAEDRDIEPAAVGSNNWVVSGAHTVTGKPLLSNDMHLAHQMPNLWYAAHLHCGDFDVAGVTLPGVPYVIVGHNRRIAWGLTNLGPTVEDAYVETFNGLGRYKTPRGWEVPERRREIIHVKGERDVIVDVLTTRHGPVISALAAGDSQQVALRWTLYDGVRNPFFEVNSAQDWRQFRQAFSSLDAPAQNVVYADVDGNIGYQATGKIPVRASGDGSLPEDGSDDAHEWIGYIAFEKLPSIYNPPSGVLATADARITADGYRYAISTEWEAPWRAERIYRVLESGQKFSAADMLGLENDTDSEFEHFAAEQFVTAIDGASKSSVRAKKAADILRQWDGRMSAESAAPTIETRARGELVRLLLEPKLGVVPENVMDESLNWRSYQWGMESVWLENILLNHPARWLPRSYVSYDELLEAAVEAAVSGPNAPQDLNSWQWGNQNAVEIRHPLFGKIPILRRWSGPGVQPQSGSGFTVKAVTRSHGPSERFTADLSNLDESTLNLVTGEAGNVLSPYFMDEWKAWYEGTTFTLPFSYDAVTARQRHRLTLAP